MAMKGVGITIAVTVAALIVLAHVSGVVVDWAWFSTIGYVSVFWTCCRRESRSLHCHLRGLDLAALD